jgi:hypothetical protein
VNTTLPRRLALTLALTGGTLLVMPTAGAEAAGMKCTHSSRAKVCFEPNGDDVLVEDVVADAWTATAAWHTDYGRTGKCGPTIRTEVCNYNMREGRTVFLRVEDRAGDDVHVTPWISVTI